MRIVIAGGSGLLGRPLAARLEDDGHAVSVLTRHARRVGDVEWNPDAPDAPWTGVVGAADAVINLAGESIAGGRWTNARKAALRDSRLRATRALAARSTPPATGRRPSSAAPPSASTDRAATSR
jgi:uncharacterized protein